MPELHPFDSVLFVAAILAGAIASVAGFGIGSLLTPVLALQSGIRAAVAAVTIPHLAGSVLRFWQLRGHVDRAVLRGFGVASALGGLTGALFHAVLRSAALTALFAGLLLFAGAAGITGFSKRFRLSGSGVWIGGATSGLFGGLVGNQGGIRSAALLGFNLTREAFVATATAVAIIVDGARLPAYLLTDAPDVAHLWPQVAIMAAGALIGTAFGRRALAAVPEDRFRRIVSSLIFLLGVYMAWQAWGECVLADTPASAKGPSA